MKRGTATHWWIMLIALLGAAGAQGCSGQVPPSPVTTAKVSTNSAERDCLIRAMYFESNRSSRDGLMAVGTVVMNRVASPLYPNTICGVVGQPRQFAAGVLTRPLNPRELPLVEQVADAVLKGERYAPIGNAKHFHVAGLNIPHRVRYVAVAGGNAFYLRAGDERRRRKEQARVMAAAAPVPNTEVAASALIKTADQSPGPSFMKKFYAGVSAAFAANSSAAPACKSATPTFGASSLACEDEIAAKQH